MPVEGKAHRRRRRVKERKMEAMGLGKDTTPATTGNTRRCQNMAKKTWADVVKAGGINVQIVLGNGNLGLVPQRKRGERRGAERGCGEWGGGEQRGGGGTWRRVNREARGRGRRAETGGETES
jgi:hypothetical protein